MTTPTLNQSKYASYKRKIFMEGVIRPAMILIRQETNLGKKNVLAKELFASLERQNEEQGIWSVRKPNWQTTWPDLYIFLRSIDEEHKQATREREENREQRRMAIELIKSISDRGSASQWNMNFLFLMALDETKLGTLRVLDDNQTLRVLDDNQTLRVLDDNQKQVAVVNAGNAQLKSVTECPEAESFATTNSLCNTLLMVDPEKCSTLETISNNCIAISKDSKRSPPSSPPRDREIEAVDGLSSKPSPPREHEIEFRNPPPQRRPPPPPPGGPSPKRRQPPPPPPGGPPPPPRSPTPRKRSACFSKTASTPQKRQKSDSASEEEMKALEESYRKSEQQLLKAPPPPPGGPSPKGLPPPPPPRSPTPRKRSACFSKTPPTPRKCQKSDSAFEMKNKLLQQSCRRSQQQLLKAEEKIDEQQKLIVSLEVKNKLLKESYRRSQRQVLKANEKNDEQQKQNVNLKQRLVAAYGEIDKLKQRERIRFASMCNE